MFRKFSGKDMQSTQLKTSAIRGLKAKLSTQFPGCEEYVEDIVPKKNMMQAKATQHLLVYYEKESKEIILFGEKDGPLFPSLRVLHKYPDMMPKLRVDTGAIKFVLKGADIMCPGLTSPGATIHDEVDEDCPVAIFAEGMVNPIAVGVTKMSTQQIREVNKDVGIEMCHFMGDGLWHTPSVE